MFTAETFVRVGVTAGFVATLLMIFPKGEIITGTSTCVAMEGLFETAEGRRGARWC